MQKITKLILPFIFILTAMLSSCSKKKDDPTPSSNNGNNIPGTSVTDGDYLPLTKDNYWNYTGSSFNYSLLVTGGTKMFNGITYKVVTQTVESKTPAETYLRRDGNKYYSYAPATNGGYPIELKLIDLDLAVGTAWTMQVASNIYTDVTYTLRVSGTGLTRTVNSIQYTNVISVDLTTSMALSASAIQLYKSAGLDDAYINSLQAQLAAQTISQTTYYAKNIGLIEQTSATASLTVQLQSSTIK